MEEEEDNQDMLQPFWLENSQADRRRLRRSYSFFLSSSALLILLLVTALVLTFIVVPTLRSFTSRIFKPHLVKKGWDSLNLVLVLFAIACGFLSRNTNESPRSYKDQSFSNAPHNDAKLNPATPRPRYEYSDRTVYKSFNRLRSFNSYPDLRQESLFVTADERWRFYDDTNVSGYHGLDLDEHRQLRQRQPRPEAEDEMGIKSIAIDTSAARTNEVSSRPPHPEPQPPSSPSPPPSSPPQATRKEDVRRNVKRTYQDVGQAEIIEKPESNDLGTENSQPRPSTPPPQPRRPTPPPPPPLPTERKMAQSKKKRGIATKEFLTSLRGKRKKQRHRSVENFESILNSETSPAAAQPQSTAPRAPPPPPPPPPSVFHNLFSSKESRHKKRHLAPRTLPQPHISSKPVSKTKPRNEGMTTHKPRLSNKGEHSYSLEDNLISGNESPLIPIPLPPPPPPFNIPAWKFSVHGDFVRVDSISSSRSGSPDLNEVDSRTNQANQCNSPFAPDGDEPAILLFCSSPDVDTKADTFIDRFRAGLRMEKMNSMKEKQGIGKSNLGPSPDPETKEAT